MGTHPLSADLMILALASISCISKLVLWGEYNGFELCCLALDLHEKSQITYWSNDRQTFGQTAISQLPDNCLTNCLTTV